jgi:hypothetical protein
MQTADPEPPQLLDQECDVQEFIELCRWTSERLRKRLDVWKNGLVQVAESKRGIKG